MRSAVALAVLLLTLWVAACGSEASSADTASVLCGGGGQTCGKKQCDPTLGCVDCTVDTDCTGAAKLCILGRCEACRANTDCGAAEPACWPSDHKCHASCATPGGSAAAICSNDKRICDAPSRQCLGCKSSTDCSPNATVCSSTTHECVQCAANTDCPVSAPRCLARVGRCAQCTSNSDCGAAAPICDPDDFRCKAGCTSDGQCSGATPKCNKTGKCAACVSDAQCSGTTPYCVNERCLTCRDENACPASKTN